jgi:hypothetical protein
VSIMPPTAKTARRSLRFSPVDDELFAQAAALIGESVWRLAEAVGDAHDGSVDLTLGFAGDRHGGD